MLDYEIRDSEQGITILQAFDLDDAQERYIDTCEAKGVVHGNLRIRCVDDSVGQWLP